MPVKKYATYEDYLAAKRERNRAERRLDAEIGRIHGNDVEQPRPPPEVLAERDFRYELISAMSAGEQHTSTPPVGYSAHYYLTAYRHQRRLARGG